MAHIVFEAEPGARGEIADGTIHTPLVPLYLAAAVAVFVIGIAFGAVRFGWFKEPAPVASVVAERALTFADGPAGTVVVRDAVSGAEVKRIASDQDGFVRYGVRALAKRRTRAGGTPDQAFVLTQWSDGRLTLFDPVTRDRIEVASFGPDQVRGFRGLLDER
jgi:putative photosynthetic complex assembly protein